MSSNDKSEPEIPVTPSTTPIIQSLQESTDSQPKTTIQRLAMASAMAMVNQFQKIGDSTNSPPTKK
jgi:hypothetical protein